MKKYEVIAKCGHVGKNFYAVKVFAVEASNGKEAAEKVRFFPRVKHDRKDAILSVRPINEDRYYFIIEQNHCDPYFRCKSRQEQEMLCPDLIRFPEKNWMQKEEKRQYNVVMFHKKKIRNYKKYVTKYIPFEDDQGLA